VCRPLTFGGFMDEEKRAKLRAMRDELERKQQALREAMDFINDDRHLTVEGIRLRESLYREMEEIKRDTEAVRQEHRLD
jgi:cell division protein ZapA (FtsZ GTPase activity inhibitor)